MESRIPASERTHQKLTELLSHGVADGDARHELIKLAVRKIVEEALEAEVSDVLGLLSVGPSAARSRPRASAAGGHHPIDVDRVPRRHHRP